RSRPCPSFAAILLSARRCSGLALRNDAPTTISELDPGRCMIARLLPTAHLPVHVRRDQTVSNRRAEQQMIDPKARVPGPRVSVVVPEGIDALTRMKRAQRVGPALREQTMERLPNLGPEQRVIDPALGLINVEFGGHHVEI